MKTPPDGRPASANTLRSAIVAIVLAATGMGLASAAHAADTEASEGDTMEFTVKLGAAPNGWAVRYKYRTKDRSAHAGDDYESTSGTVVFPSGVKEKTVSVNTIDDNDEEHDERFRLKLYDQEVNGLYTGVTGWIAPTTRIRSMPRKITLTGKIRDDDTEVKMECGNSYC